MAALRHGESTYHGHAVTLAINPCPILVIRVRWVKKITLGLSKPTWDRVVRKPSTANYLIC